MLGHRERGRSYEGGQFPAIPSLPTRENLLPFFLRTPKIGVPRACGALRGIQSRVWETSVLLPSRIRGTLSPSLSFPPLPLSCVPSPHSQFPVAFLPSAPFLFHHPSRLYRLPTPPASPLSKHPLHSSPSGPNTPLPPALQTDESKLSGFTSFEPGLFFFPRPPDEKLRDALRRRLYLVPRVTGAVLRNGAGERGEALSPPFPTAVPPRQALPG